MAVADDIERAKREAATKLAEAEKLEHLSKLYPDLQKRVGRWNKVTYYSKAANVEVVNFDMRHNCGCCADSPLEIWPYKVTEHGKVYSDPPCFTVGERNAYSYGDTSYTNWDKGMRDAGIPESIIASVACLFESTEESEANVDDR